MKLPISDCRFQIYRRLTPNLEFNLQANLKFNLQSEICNLQFRISHA